MHLLEKKAFSCYNVIKIDKAVKFIFYGGVNNGLYK